MIKIDLAKCTKCGFCVEECPGSVISAREDGTPWVRYPRLCNACGHCIAICPTGAVTGRNLRSDLFREVTAAGLPPESVEDLLLSRRSTRVFADRPVSKDILEQLIRCGTNAGTASNAQSEAFIVIQDKKTLSDLSDLVLQTIWSSVRRVGNPLGRVIAKAADGKQMYGQTAAYYSMLKEIKNGQLPSHSVFYNAPAVILTHGLRKNPLAATNAALATRNMEVLALPMGLGTCWMGFLVLAAWRNKKVANFLGLPPDRNVFGAITVGYPKRRYPKTIPRRERPLRWV